MYFKTIAPAFNLSKYVKRYWIAINDNQTCIREIDPDTNICLCIHYNKTIGYKYINNESKDCIFEKDLSQDTPTTNAIIIGPHKGIIVETSSNSLLSFGIEFYTGYSNDFFGIPISKIGETVMEATTLKLPFINEIESLLKNRKIETLASLINNYLTNFYIHKMDNLEWHDLINGIRNVPFNIKVSELADHQFLCTRQYNRIFKDLTGLSPKQFVMAAKPPKIIEYLYEGKSLQEIIKICGYFDQSQLNRDFKFIGGVTAIQVLKNLTTRKTCSPDPLIINYDENGICYVKYM